MPGEHAPRLGIDFGTSNTVAILRSADRTVRPLLFDGSPLLPSAVYAEPGGRLLVGRDAWHSMRIAPARFEPYPKQRIDEGAVLLGDLEVPVPDLVAAVLRRVATEADRVTGDGPVEAVLTCPSGWGAVRRQVLQEVASGVFPRMRLVVEPVAAASYFVAATSGRVPVGGYAAVYDFGAGTLDPERWARLTSPVEPEDQRLRRMFWDDVRTAKEMLARTSATMVHIPLFDVDVPLAREELDDVARPVVQRTVDATREALDAAGIRAGDLAGLFLVGGASRLQLAATLLHREFDTPPTVTDQPELVVAEGSLHAAGPPEPDREPDAWPRRTGQGPVAAGRPPPTRRRFRPRRWRLRHRRRPRRRRRRSASAAPGGRPRTGPPGPSAGARWNCRAPARSTGSAPTASWWWSISATA